MQVLLNVGLVFILAHTINPRCFLPALPPMLLHQCLLTHQIHEVFSTWFFLIALTLYSCCFLFHFQYPLVISCCFHNRNNCLSQPSLRRLSPVSSLLCRDPTSGRPSSPLRLQDFNFLYPLLQETVRPPRYACNPLCARHALLTPAESPRTRLTSDSCCLRLRGKIGFRTMRLTGLNRFTLSHCGSRTPTAYA